MLLNNNEYLKIMESIKSEIKSAQYKAAVSVNRELIMLYYNIGCVINDHKIWGNKFIENLAADIRMEFPGVTGYSVRNLKYMAKFATKFSDIEIVQAVLAQLREYVVNPYQIAAANGRYYLICNYDKYDDVANYRLDRITNIKLLPTPAKPMEKVKGLENGFDLPKHMAEHIYMFAGESGIVTFRAKKYLLNDIIDWFGGGVTFFDETDEEVSVRVRVNFAAMRRWALQYALHTKILSPEPLSEQVRNDIKEATENYEV